LLRHLFAVLRSQIQLVKKLRIGSTQAEKLLAHLKSQLELELELLNKIEKIENFHALFLALLKGEHIIHTMDAREKRLLNKMQKRFRAIFSNEIDDGITCAWAMTVYNAVQDVVMNHEAILARGFDPHPDVDFEFVNRPEFVDLAKESIQHLRTRKVSEQMVSVFVYLFREWYNHERD
jgi:hypothetical protein